MTHPLRRWRTARKLTQAAFGELIGCGWNAVWRYENEGRIPEAAILQRIIDATGGAVTPNDFFDLDAEKPGITAVATGNGAAQTIKHRRS